MTHARGYRRSSGEAALSGGHGPPRAVNRSRFQVAVVIIALASLLASCSAISGRAPAPESAPTLPMPSRAVRAVAIDPGDGKLLIASDRGLFEVYSNGVSFPRGPLIDLTGFTVTDTHHAYLASGYRTAGGAPPRPAGLLRSSDGGQTWTPVSRERQSVFRALTFSTAGILGFDGTLLRSADGQAWSSLQIAAEPRVLAANPDGSQIFATTASGLLRSTDAGSSWTAVEDAPALDVVAWADDSTAVGVDLRGTSWVSVDAGSTWRRGASTGAAPVAVTAATRSGSIRVVVATATEVLDSRDGGMTFTVLLRG